MKFDLKSYLKYLCSFEKTVRFPKEAFISAHESKEAQAGFQVEHPIKFHWNWKKKESLIYGDSGTEPSELILSMDLVTCSLCFDSVCTTKDDTLIRSVRGLLNWRCSDDCTIWHPSVKQKLHEYHDKGYKLVIFTNQRGIAKGVSSEETIKEQIERLTSYIGLEFQAFIASDLDQYRKPNLGSWRVLKQEMNGNKTIDLNNSIYVGDSAGRGKAGWLNRDYCDFDYDTVIFSQSKFALNIGLQFHTPESFFLNIKEELPKLVFNPKDLSEDAPIFQGKPRDTKVTSNAKEMIVFVGSPASGKSTFRKSHLSEYVHVNQDTLKTQKRCLETAENALKAGKSVVIDNTNPEVSTRSKYINLAKQYNYPVRCFFFDVSKDLSFHLDNLRLVNPYRTHNSKRVGSVAIYSYYKKLQKPELIEGYEEIEFVNFVSGPFISELDKEIFYSYNE